MKLINQFKIYIYINLVVCWLIFLTKNYEEPLKCNIPSKRIFGILSQRDILTTIFFGSILGYIVNNSIVKGIIIEFFIGQFFHLIYSTNTMFLYNLNLSQKPNGTGYIPNCVKL